MNGIAHFNSKVRVFHKQLDAEPASSALSNNIIDVTIYVIKYLEIEPIYLLD